jgi:hypothetical protein
MAATLFTQNIIACIWDFDKTLIPEYMQSPIFRKYGVDEATFWAETNALVENYRRRGYTLSGEISYLNHLLTYVLSGPMGGLNNAILRKCGAEIAFYPGLPGFFGETKAWVTDRTEHRKHDITLEHYVVSTGLAQMIRGSAIAPYVEGIWGCEFIENPLQPGFLEQKELEISAEAEIAQIGMVIDNTTKTRAIFEINKGTNKNPAIDVNSKVAAEDRRIPFQNMIYIADGPSDVPSFSLVKGNGGIAYGVYNPAKQDEYAQNDRLRKAGRIDHYGPADYTASSSTSQWLRLQIHGICDRIARDREAAVSQRTAKPPRHLNPTPGEEARRKAPKAPEQSKFLE